MKDKALQQDSIGRLYQIWEQNLYESKDPRITFTFFAGGLVFSNSFYLLNSFKCNIFLSLQNNYTLQDDRNSVFCHLFFLNSIL